MREWERERGRERGRVGEKTSTYTCESTSVSACDCTAHSSVCQPCQECVCVCVSRDPIATCRASFWGWWGGVKRVKVGAVDVAMTCLTLKKKMKKGCCHCLRLGNFQQKNTDLVRQQAQQRAEQLRLPDGLIFFSVFSFYKKQDPGSISSHRRRES